MKKYIPFLFILLLFGCELIVDVEVPFGQPQLVLNTFFHPDSVWSATISLNRHILSDLPFASVEDATVIMYQNDSPIDTLIHQQNGFYKSKSNKPLINTEYEIRASTAEYGMINGKSKIPMPAPISHVDVKNREASATEGESTVINVTFQDNAAEVNYYEIMVQIESEWYNGYDGTIHKSRRPVNIESNDHISNNNETFWDGGVIFKDILFNGKEFEISVNTQYTTIQDSETVIVSLQTLSEDSYKYKTTVQLQNETSGDPFAQPVNVTGNIENGFGIFAGYSQSVVARSGPKPVITGVNPSKGKVGDHVIISGENLFDGEVIFRAGEIQAPAASVWSTENEIEVIVPSTAATGKIVVYTNIGLAIYDFEVIN